MILNLNSIKYSIIFLIFLVYKSFSFEVKELNINLKNNTQNNILSLKDVDLIYENGIPVYYTIKKTKYQDNGNIDLYISFDKTIEDQLSNYKVIYKNLYYSENIAISNKSGYFIGEDKRLELVGDNNSFFKSDINLTSFSISFWIYPLTYAKDETVLKIGSQYFNSEKSQIENESINAKIVDGKVVWDFINIFSDKSNKYKLKIESYNRIEAEKWSHITISYNSFTGIITLYINGNEEAIAVATKDGRLQSNKFNLRFDKSNRCIITIAPSFYGAIDELYILTNENPINRTLFSNRGEITSCLYEFKNGIIIQDIKTIEEKENGSDIYYYVRYSNKPFDQRELIENRVNWAPLTKDILYKEIKYFQWKAVLLSGKENNYAPRFRGIKIFYEENIAPSRPTGLKVMQEGNSVKLKWLLNREKDVKGYKIYYGTKPNSYFGAEAKEGKSPIDIGLQDNFTLTGLDPEKIYYFAITAYDDEEHNHESDFSDEVFIRPFTFK